MKESKNLKIIIESKLYSFEFDKLIYSKNGYFPETLNKHENYSNKKMDFNLSYIQKQKKWRF